MEINYTKLGERIRFYRQQAKLSQEELAEATELSNVHVSKIENGNTKPSVEIIVNIATTLRITPDLLLIDSLPEHPQNKNDLNTLLLECTPEEVSILVDNFTGLKKALSKYQIKE